MDYTPLKFIGEEIEVVFDKPPLLEKTPSCPDGFVWGGGIYRVTEILNEWRDFSRRGKMGKTIKPARLARAVVKGSWGVGRFYFRVRLEDGRIFDLYYDRAVKDVDHRKGSWFLYRQLVEVTGRDS
jgi:hypothetical protein